MYINENPLYKIELWEPACPSFCSFSKCYFGTLADMKRVLERAKELGEYNETKEALEEYFKGNVSATHNIVYQEIPVLEKVKMIDEKSFEMADYVWIHRNIWDDDVSMHFKHAYLQRIIVQIGDTYLVCLKGKFRKLGYKLDSIRNDKLPFERIDRNNCWGNKLVIDSERDIFESLLYVKEESFEHDFDAARKYYDDSYINMTQIINEVFADG